MPNWRKVVVSGSAPTLSGLTVKGPLEVSMTASSGTIPLSILAASDLSTDTLIKIRDDGNSYDLLTLDSEGAIKIREAGNSGEGGGIYIQSGGTTADHANMYINGGTARLSISKHGEGAFTVVPGGQSNGYLVGLTGKGTMALGQGATAGTKPSENNTNTLYITNGTNPTNTPTDSFALFSKDVNSEAGTASPTFLTEDDTTIQLGVTSSLDHVEATTFKGDGSALTNLPPGTTPTLQQVTDQGATTTNNITISGDLTASADISLPTNISSINFVGSAGIRGRTDGSYPGLHLASGTGTSNRIWFGKSFTGTSAVTASFLNIGAITNVNEIVPHVNYPLILKGGPNSNSSNDGVRIDTAGSTNGVFFNRFEIESDSDTVDAYFQNINGLGINKTSNFSAELDVSGDINASGDITSSKFLGDNFVKNGGTSTQFLKADGSVDSTTYYSVASTIQATAGSAASPAYTFFTDQNSGFFKSGNDVIGASAGGSKVLDISSEGITVYGDIVKNGGTSAQFLKADGSVDSTTYLSSLTGAVLTTGDQTASGTKTFSGTVKISNAVNAGFDTNKFLVLDTTDKIDFRTGAEVRADIDAAADGANSDITSLSGLTTALSVGQGGTGLTTLSSGEVPYGNGTSALNTNGAFVFDQSVKQLQLTGDSSNAPLKLTNVQANAEETKVGLILNSTNDGVEKATLGSNAFTSTTIPTNNNQLTNGQGFYASGDTIRVANGSQGSPGLAFSNDTNTGFYAVAGDTFAAVAGSTLAQSWFSTGTSMNVPMLALAGTDSAPGISFTGDTNTGFYASNSDEISVTRGGTQSFKFDANGFQQLVAGGTSQFAGHLQAHCLGIGGTPSTTSGEIWAYGDIVANKSSDRRLKKYIKNIKNPLDKLSKINGVTFEWKKTDEKMKKEVHSHEGYDVGVIAQEIEEVLPEIVATRDNGYKAVYYEKLIPLLIESVKELKAEVDELKKSK